MTRVKICGLTRMEDAEAALTSGADALGFIFEPSSPRFIGNNGVMVEAPAALGPYALCVAVYGVLRPAPSLFQMVQFVEGDQAQVPSIRVFRLKSGMQASQVLGAISHLPYVLLDAHSESGFGGQGEKVDWNVAAEIRAGFEGKLILAGGLTPDNVSEAVRRVRPYAVDVSSGVETQTRVKDPSMIRDFIAAAKAT